MPISIFKHKQKHNSFFVIVARWRYLCRNFPDQPNGSGEFFEGESSPSLFLSTVRVSSRVLHLNGDWWYRRANRRISPDVEDPYTKLDYNDIGARISGPWLLVTRRVKIESVVFYVFFLRNTQDFAKIDIARDKQGKSREEYLLNLSLYL